MHPPAARNPVAERLEREVSKIEAKLKAMGLPVPKPQGSPAALARAALADLAASQPIKPSPSVTTTRPSTAATMVSEGDAATTVAGSLPASPPNHAHRHRPPHPNGSSLRASQQLPPLTAEQELASYLILKPPTLRLNLRGREVNGQKRRPPPSPPPPPTPPPLTMVERLDQLLTEVVHVGGSPTSSGAIGAQGDVPLWLRQPSPAPSSPPGALNAAQQQQALPGSSGAPNFAGEPHHDRGSASEAGHGAAALLAAGLDSTGGAGGGTTAGASQGGDGEGDAAAAAALPEWAQGMPRGWSPLTDMRAWSAMQATNRWVSPMQLRGSLLADLGEQEKMALRARSRSPPPNQGQPHQQQQHHQQQAAGHETAAAGAAASRPAQRVEQAVESVQHGAIPLRW